jgi:ABC-2 type transport system permease protein
VNFHALLAMLARDAHVARRNLVPLLLQTLLQPILVVFVFGRILTASGFMRADYKMLLLPGIIAISMVMSGIQGVAMPLLAEFQWTREIEDRLLAPIEVEWVAVGKVVAGSIQSLVAGLVVIPAAFLVMGSLGLSGGHLLLFTIVALLVAAMAASIGLLLGSTVGQTNIGLMFSLVIAPMIFFGCTYYPWKALDPFPVMQSLVLVNPMVYASEGLRGSLVPDFPHLSSAVTVAALVGFNMAFLCLGIWQFKRKAVS